ncbi:MAG: hypothetical protein GEU77_15610 [Deltaproteobacteria bacterium]|nr:hypothetical protein [Deltaproteobacteria bacterium]
MMQDLHRRDGAFGLGVGDVRDDFALGLERGKYVVARSSMRSSPRRSRALKSSAPPSQEAV